MARRKRKTTNNQATPRPAIKLPQQMQKRDYIEKLKNVHLPFMLYTGAHSAVNAGIHAFGSAEGALGIVLVFSVMGIIGMEYVGYQLFHAIVDRSVIGFQKWICVGSYFLIMGSICWGIQSHYSESSMFSHLYYNYILPASPIATLFLVLVIYLIDPFKQADEDEASLALDAYILKKRASNERTRYQLRESKEWMRLDWSTFENRMKELWTVSKSGDTKKLLAQSAQLDFMDRLKKVHKLNLLTKAPPAEPGTQIEVGDLDGNGLPDFITVEPGGDGAPNPNG